ncbi:MAG: NusG domain II-containing protein [Eubacterium sp.]|nr:NusG domain II-containing protein [Eubacterium sp.]
MEHSDIFRKQEMIIIAAVVIIGAVLAAVLFLMKKPGSVAVVSVDGKETARYDLDEDIDTEIQGVGGTNRLIISAGTVRIEEADCPDKLCVKQGEISDVGQSIICLPHRVSVRVEGTADDEVPDAVTAQRCGSEKTVSHPHISGADIGFLHCL